MWSSVPVAGSVAEDDSLEVEVAADSIAEDDLGVQADMADAWWSFPDDLG